MISYKILSIQNITKCKFISTAQESQILKAMSSFSLPAENIPPWARALSDDQWQNQVLQRIKEGPKGGQEVAQLSQEKSAEEGSNSTWTANFDENS